jgi:hypothetical protein
VKKPTVRPYKRHPAKLTVKCDNFSVSAATKTSNVLGSLMCYAISNHTIDLIICDQT